MFHPMTVLGWFTGLVLGTAGLATLALASGYAPWNGPAQPPLHLIPPLVPPSLPSHPSSVDLPLPALIHGQVQVDGRPLEHGLLLLKLPKGPTIPVPIEGGQFHLVAPAVEVEIKVRCATTGWESSPRSQSLRSGPQLLRLDFTPGS